MRGFLKGFDPGVEKTWKVGLLETDVFWQEMVNRRMHPEIDSRADIKQRIARTKRKHEEYFNRKFIYFICTREKVRFAADRPAQFSVSGEQLCVHLCVHGREDPIACAIPSDFFLGVDERGRAWLPSVTSSDVALTFTYPGRHRQTISVHDFLNRYEVNLGIDTCVHYVGLTKNPDSRPLLRRHDGRGRVERRAKRENRDVLFFYNTFAVRYFADDPRLGASYWVSNAFTDDMDIDAEGLTLEKLFVRYFLPDCQGSLKSELSQLRSRVETLATRHRVRRIEVEYEVEGPSEYYRFYSDARQPSRVLSFAIDTSADPHGPP